MMKDRNAQFLLLLAGSVLGFCIISSLIMYVTRPFWINAYSKHGMLGFTIYFEDTPGLIWASKGPHSSVVGYHMDELEKYDRSNPATRLYPILIGDDGNAEFLDVYGDVGPLDPIVEMPPSRAIWPGNAFFIRDCLSGEYAILLERVDNEGELKVHKFSRKDLDEGRGRRADLMIPSWDQLPAFDGDLERSKKLSSDRSS